MDTGSFAAGIAHAHAVCIRRYGEAAAAEYLADAAAQSAVLVTESGTETTYIWPDGSRLQTADGLLVEPL